MRNSKLSPAQKELYLVPFEKLKSSKAWKLTSEYIRKKAKGRCYTCTAILPFEKMVAGHAIEKRGHANIYFDMDCLRAQCSRCNRRLHGNHSIFAATLIYEIGPERFKEMHKRAIKSRVYTKADLERIEKKMVELLKTL